MNTVGTEKLGNPIRNRNKQHGTDTSASLRDSAQPAAPDQHVFRARSRLRPFSSRGGSFKDMHANKRTYIHPQTPTPRAVSRRISGSGSFVKGAFPAWTSFGLRAIAFDAPRALRSSSFFVKKTCVFGSSILDFKTFKSKTFKSKTFKVKTLDAVSVMKRQAVSKLRWLEKERLQCGIYICKHKQLSRDREENRWNGCAEEELAFQGPEIAGS